MEEKNPLKSEVAKREEETLKFWQENHIFEKTLEKSADKGEFVFYDGPPFATGLPHYGHILASTIKDVIPRYKTMQGFHVPRRWGWDCHGLPIENIVEKELGFKHKKDIKEYGIEKFNERCREQVLTYAHEWERIIPRMGRFVDMEHAYRTMDRPFMESVWWVFKQLWDKGLVYEDYRSMHICPRCETTLSQQEVSEGYKDVKDISVTVEFQISNFKFQNKDEEKIKTSFLAWTTTPWTLPGNVALAVGADIDYVLIEKKDMGDGALVRFILAKERLQAVFGKDEYRVVKEMKGLDLVGIEYEPPFDYYIKDTTIKNHEHGWKVYAADFVTAESGTGIAHEAPAFGADDWELLKKENLPFVQHVNMDGTMKAQVTDFAGMEVKPRSDDDKIRLGTDIAVLKYLQDHGTFFSKENITHAYPHCWRCDTPLLNYATSSWFIHVTKIKDNLLKNAESINWSPKHVKEGRFGKWLIGARDWSVSRQRFWASAIPIWSNSAGEKRAIGSVDELKKLTKKSGNTYFVMRHGEAENNAMNIYSSDPHVHHLTETGKGQVMQTAKHLEHKKITAIYASPFLRTRETAEMVADHLQFPKEKIVYDDRLKELDFGDFSGRPASDYWEYHKMQPFSFDVPIPGGESYQDTKRRFGSFVYETDKRHAGEAILIVSHGISTEIVPTVIEGADKKRSLEMLLSRLGNKPAELHREHEFIPLPHNADYELDLHRPYIDDVELVDEKGNTLTRVSDVLDTWFDSGSMPYGEWHYPFDPSSRSEQSSVHYGAGNKELLLPRGFPAEFIAEGIDQTRAWFYYLHVLAGGLFEKNAFQNVIVNGVVLAEDGKKMSKKLKNYPDPMMIVDRYGADALRFYMLSSPIVQAENLDFSEKGVDEIYKKLILKLGNVVSFYELYKTGEETMSEPTILDRWMLSRLAQLQAIVTKHLDAYELDRASRPILDFVDDLSVWYIRRSRERFKSENKEEKNTALYYTRHILLELSKIISPFTPFLAEEVYKKVKAKDDPMSVHLCEWSKRGEIEENVLSEMEQVREVVTLVLEARSKANIKVRQPLSSLVIKADLTPEMRTILADEVNVKEVVSDSALETPFELDIMITPELKTEGNVRDFIRAIQEARKTKNLTPSESITLKIETNDIGKTFVETNAEAIKKPTNVGEFMFDLNHANSMVGRTSEENTSDVLGKNDGEQFEIENIKYKIEIQ
jgi:isoleucyl-tRNA synthetase